MLHAPQYFFDLTRAELVLRGIQRPVTIQFRMGGEQIGTSESSTPLSNGRIAHAVRARFEMAGEMS